MSTKNIHILNGHSIIAHMMARLRDEATSPAEFRNLLHGIGFILGSEALKNLPLRQIKVKTPLMKTYAQQVKNMPCIVSILRAGLSLEYPLWGLLPDMPSYDIGIKRVNDGSSTVKIEEYINKLPEKLPPKKMVIMLDPMIATGTTACHAINLVKERGAKNIIFIGIVSCNKGLQAITTEHPDVPIFCAVKDPKLGKGNFIYPGIGDCGDRYKNTLGK